MQWLPCPPTISESLCTMTFVAQCLCEKFFLAHWFGAKKLLTCVYLKDFAWHKGLVHLAKILCTANPSSCKVFQICATNFSFRRTKFSTFAWRISHFVVQTHFKRRKLHHFAQSIVAQAVFPTSERCRSGILTWILVNFARRRPSAPKLSSLLLFFLPLLSHLTFWDFVWRSLMVVCCALLLGQ